MLRQQGLIGGVWQDATSGMTVNVIDPASQSVLGTVPDMGGNETRAAIEAAEKAFKGWKARTHAERAKLLERWHDLMIDNLEDLALILTLEQGKPLAESRGEIRYGASFVKWFAEEARRIGGTTIPSPTADRRILVLKDAVGVCAIITPWNFPNAMITRKVAPALAAGCTVVIKPSEFTPFSALALGVLAERAGIPAGVINIVTGMPTEIGNELMANETVRKISFTGSTRVGSLLMRGAADSIKRLSLELGGNAPFIVFDDADLNTAVEGVISSKFRNGGQTCVCANRILVQAGIYDAFAEKLSQRVAQLKVGQGTDEDTDIGPMINEAAIAKIEKHVADAQAKGARIVGQTETMPEGRQYARPVVLADATTEMVLASEETFGPVAPLFRFETEEEALAIANGTPYGLASYFYTESLKR
ncbi:MAG: NAD-dependent succinate-semialdehyde dehydrogenase, partial [Maritimibacter sp.]